MLLLLFYYVLFKITIISNQTPTSNKNYYEIKRHNVKFQKTKTWEKEFIETLNTIRDEMIMKFVIQWKSLIAD